MHFLLEPFEPKKTHVHEMKHMDFTKTTRADRNLGGSELILDTTFRLSHRSSKLPSLKLTA